MRRLSPALELESQCVSSAFPRGKNQTSTVHSLTLRKQYQAIWIMSPSGLQGQPEVGDVKKGRLADLRLLRGSARGIVAGSACFPRDVIR
jgi:hypothetical protein